MTSIPPRDPLRSLRAVLACVDGVRHLPALAVLLGTFAAAGLLLAMLAQAVARGQGATMVLYGVLAFLVAFYGGNAAGLMVMDDARGQPRRGIVDALATALRTAHRLLGALLLIAIAYAAGALLLALVLVVCKAPVLGPAAYTVVLPVAVVIAGLALLVLPTVVVPLAAPAVWEGADTLQCVSRLFAIARRRLLEVVLLMLVVGLLASVVGALVMFVVAVGGQVVARLSAWILGPQAPAQQLMAGLFGFGLRSLTGAGVNVGASAYAAAGVIGGGVVAVVGSVLPGLVYLRGACEVYLAHADAEDEAASGHDPARPGGAAAGTKAAGAAAGAARSRGILATVAPEASALETTITMARSPLASTTEVDVPLDLVATVACCPACQHAVQPGDHYCGTCGAPLDGDRPEAAPR
ncbi:zinc ribbon domain-containing protein [Caldimonas thermodepolymerans]|uniref:Uncharacterized protein n=1 Tax=Caldimonas thermodepolymerans TaxID=215580 RepID=A0AA46HUH2_9BURK|nr:zinc ribbon domain-containing protein [Caldimonas thermodepolymerans]QPC31598.1 zinc ribbon domain-containing protein [Caldimonas thermodepolymerans]RDH95367.1 hypothetical protein DES46_11424 [Caldimonas thermodepolymerans]TCP03145.1 hypothetical protein EV676_11424 [Caldimonas thermodepolymerans]UZG48015.1 zinc ribbon domain-containing protein [Caldimonas thermodepolymerans]